MTGGDFHGTFYQELLKNIILSFSGIGIGIALWRAVYDIIKGIETEGRARRLWISRGIFVASFMGILALLGYVILGSPVPITINWLSIVYTILVVIASTSGTWVAVELWLAERDAKAQKDRGRYL